MARRKTRFPMLAEPRLVFIDDLEVWIVQRNVKNVSLYVKQPDAHVEVHANPLVSEKTIADLVRSRRDWIRKKQDEILQSPMAKAALASPEEVEEWRTVVKAVAPSLVKKWEAVLGVKAGKLSYRNMKTRWGSCQPSTGRICLNIRLALYPPECLEYVVVHELCHLIVSGHGPDFHALMDSALPNWRSIRKKLR